jgi:hypothetical protein
VTDPDTHAAIDRAIRLLAVRLAAVSPLADPQAAARSFVDELMAGDDRWRPIPLPPEAAARRDPDAYHRGAQRARAALTRTPQEAHDDLG